MQKLNSTILRKKIPFTLYSNSTRCLSHRSNFYTFPPRFLPSQPYRPVNKTFTIHSFRMSSSGKGIQPGEGFSASIPHAERTADEPRENHCHSVIISRIQDINDTIRIFELEPATQDGSTDLTFLPGQWLDVFTPPYPERPGGFTITSPPSALHPPPDSPKKPYLELAIQKSPSNPPANYLFQHNSKLISSKLLIRVGGSFIYPPSPTRPIRRLVFVAGGVGVNPLMSMLSHIASLVKAGEDQHFEIRFLYTVRCAPSGNLSKIQFLERIQREIKTIGQRAELQLFLTSGEKREIGGVELEDTLGPDGTKLDIQRRRINKDDLLQALGPVSERNDVVCYICGVPRMTDDFIEIVRDAEGMEEKNVLFEKWW
ncbi:hypothetical protein HYFRA_00012562 [Hymenoscyphus fraxineus]|uniref:FAD-binding FR-type domain-containing protein n=1 Tax=Hymenoscyphus fraxineus TaxID=746836 RepID=A0A9N9L4A9_9HELO|nr:hypothetical protein HYFRA_00012562 [Hymenoscyphus fraxineus]